MHTKKGLAVFKRYAIALTMAVLASATIASGAFAAPTQVGGISGNRSAHQADTLTQLPEKMPQWALDGSPYVQVVDYRAVVSPAIYTSGLNPQTIQDVVSAVSSYNSLNMRIRKDGITRSAPSAHQSQVGASTGVTPNVPPWCTDVVRSNPVWWGWSYWMNHCAGNDLLYGGSAAGAVIALFSGPGAPIIGTAVALEAADLAWSMSQCSDGSAFWNFPYSGGWWFAPGC